MKHSNVSASACIFCCVVACIGQAQTTEPLWSIDNQTEWESAADQASEVQPVKGLVSGQGSFSSRIQTFDRPTQLSAITFEQSPVWNNWKNVGQVGPRNLCDAPVLLSLGENDYWIFGRYAKKPVDDPNQTDGKGSEQKNLRGYHAWHSKDMVNWVHHGPITDFEYRWMTTAEYHNGKFYFYSDVPNDTDPHLIIDENLFDGKVGKKIGLVYQDDFGSDMGVIKDLDGKFHLISENWSPINARLRAWDSPLADHAVSPDGIKPFKNVSPAVDHRTQPTGEFKHYRHPHWGEGNSNQYEVHRPVQNAYGDWTIIRIGRHYHLFGDYDQGVAGNEGKKTPAKHMKVGRFTAPSINQEFQFSGTFGSGHPDPTVGFAEGQFYLVSQNNDFVSPGPWVDAVEARVGLDTTGNGKIDQWTQWQVVREQYDHTPDYARVVHVSPASIDLSKLPPAHGVKFEFKLNKATNETDTQPLMDKVIIK